MLTSAGKEGKTTVFLLTDMQIKEESFLEDVDGLLNAGEVPNLFALDEKQEILEVSCNMYTRDPLMGRGFHLLDSFDVVNKCTECFDLCSYFNPFSLLHVIVAGEKPL